MLHPDRLLPSNPAVRDIARRLYKSVEDLAIISPHGHCDSAWFAENKAFSDPVRLFLQPDHYLFRMLYSQGISLEQIGLEGRSSIEVASDMRQIWRLFCQHYYLFRGTPSRIWLDHSVYEICGIKDEINADNADRIYDQLQARLSDADFRPRALFERFNIELLATTESPLDDLQYHQQIQQSPLAGKIITTYRPDAVVDPEFENFADNLAKFAAITETDISDFSGYLLAHQRRRQYFKQFGATATDHGHASAATANLSASEAAALYDDIRRGQYNAEAAELFRGQMITEMAKMSLQDGLVMQFHAGCFRNHNQQLFENFGRDVGADIPLAVDYVQGLKPLLDCVGNERDLNIILFTLDETTYSRELATLVGHYPCLTLGPAWWFHDSVQGMRRYKQQVIETAGFYNTAGFNDDTRAFLSIPARHDVARRVDCGFLAELVAEHQLDETEALSLAIDLSGELAKKAYKL